ncbi:nucleoside hydrolase [soil metagenome]
MERVPILLDTDPGSDIDDAVAMAYLLHQPRCELLGITTVTGDVQKRAALVEMICRAAGREDVPIHIGRRLPLLHGPGQPNVPHYEPVSDLPHRLDRRENTAVGFLRDTIRSRPGEITLLTIGPYSNIALLFALDPEIPFLVKGLVSMGGQFFAPGLEWNARCDPVATQMVYGTPRRDHLSVGLDVTLQCRLSAEEVHRRFVGEPLATVLRMTQSWFRHASDITFHDPLAAAAIFHPDLMETRTGTVTVDSEGGTSFTEGDGPDRVAETVHRDAFFEEYFDVMRG